MTEKRSKKLYTSIRRVHGFPDYKDTLEFNSKILKKKEFYIHKSKKIGRDANLDEESRARCSGFKLSDNQKFLKSFMNSDTPYNSLLLFHGTGTGKTCSSISIAEQYAEELMRQNKKIIVVLNPSIQDNFKKNIFNKQLVNIENPGNGKETSQCLRDKYLKMIKTKKFRDYNDMSNKIDRRIKSAYTFYGYQTLANKLKKWTPAQIKAYFSNTVLIIDEVHNIKENSEDTDKLAKLLKDKLVSKVSNMKLLLLSATPMFNEPTEIVYLLNLLLYNSGQIKSIDEEIKESDLEFTEDGELTPECSRFLSEKSTGLVSFLRSENPLTFPTRIYPHPDELITNFPTKLYDNETPVEPIKDLKIVPCVMQGKQKEIYEIMKEKSDYGSIDINGIMASDIVFPHPNPEKEEEVPLERRRVVDYISGDNFWSHFTPDTTNPKKLYKYRTDPVSSTAKEIYSYPNIKNYSSKIAKIVEGIKNCKEGIIFIYSRFVWVGAVSIAFALEHAGAKRWKKNGKTEQLIVDNTGKSGEKFPMKDVNYLLITGNQKLSADSYKDYLTIQDQNKDGSKVKVIIGSESAKEGLDFKYIREVHILDPWFHLNKLEQVIGRGIRNCSHIDLPLEMRNVLVYHYAAVLDKDPSKEPETVDLKIYREAEKKDRSIGKVERLLRENAIDCENNKNVNEFNGAPFDKPIKMKTSRGNEIEVRFEDLEGSKKCNYGSCKYTCQGIPLDTDKTKFGSDTKTFSYRSKTDDIEEVLDKLKLIFSRNSYIKLREITRLDIFNGVENQFIYLALDKLLREDIPIFNKYKKECRLVYSEGFYFPLDSIYYNTDSSGTRILLKQIEGPLLSRIKKLDLSKAIDKLGPKAPKLKDTSEEMTVNNLLINVMNGNKLVYSLNNGEKELIMDTILRQLASAPENVTLNDLLLNFRTQHITNFPTEVIEDVMDSENPDKDKIRRILGYEFTLNYLNKLNLVDRKTNNYDYYYFNTERNDFVFRRLNLETGEILEFNKEEDTTESKRVNRIFKFKKGKISKTENGNLVGFIDRDNEFKIRDSLKKSKTKITGRVCGTYPMNDIKEYIGSKLLTKNFTMSNLKRVKKEVLCQLLIKIFMDSNTKELNTFLTVEESSWKKMHKK